MKVSQFSKFLATLPGLIALVVSLNVLHGHVLTVAIVAEAVVTRLLVLLSPKNTDRTAAPEGEVDTGPGVAVPFPGGA